MDPILCTGVNKDGFVVTSNFAMQCRAFCIISLPFSDVCALS